MATNDNLQGGMFGFQELMSDYYGSDPKDDAGKLQKRTFQADMIQQAMISQQTEQRAAKAQEYEMSGMKQAMDLDLRNQEQLAQTQFGYQTQGKAQDFDLQERFATSDSQREADRMTLAANLQNNQSKLEGDENRLSLGEQGRQQRETIGTTAAEERTNLKTQGSIDINKIGATGSEQRANIREQTEADIKKVDVLADADIKRNVGTVEADVTRATDTQKGVAGGTQMEQTRQAGDIAKETIGAQGDQDVRKVAETGKQTRETMGAQTRETAKDRANQRSYSRELAAR